MLTQSDARTPRYLGAAFVFQFATSLTAGMLSTSILAGSITEVLPNISSNLGQMRTTIVLELLTSVGIIVMTSLLYVVLQGSEPGRRACRSRVVDGRSGDARGEDARPVRPVGCERGIRRCRYSRPPPPTETLGTLSLGISQHAGDIGMLFFCLGGLLWYYLLFQSRIVPRLLSLWGLVAVPLVLVATVLLIWDHSLDPSIALYALYVPFELVLGLWLLIKGATVAPTRLEGASAPGGLRGTRKDVVDAKEHHSPGSLA